VPELGPVAFAIACNLGDAFPSAGGAPPVPPEWARLAQDSHEALTVDDILMRLVERPH
jgi:hypothetical protein